MRLTIGKKIIIVIALAFFCAVFFLTFFLAKQTSAQTDEPKIFASWASESYVPPAFRGKVMPTAGSPIKISFELIDGGRVADLSNQTIFWYLNNNLISNVPGKQSAEIIAPQLVPANANVRIEIPKYPGGAIFKTIKIPIVQPEAVIEHPYQKNEFFDDQVLFFATPYFFGAKELSDLKFSWTANGQEADESGNPRELTVNLGAGTRQGFSLGIGLSVVNSKKSDESASHIINLKYSK